jgi:hypothetical protein
LIRASSSFSETNAAMPRVRIVRLAARSINVRISNELLTVDLLTVQAWPSDALDSAMGDSPCLEFNLAIAPSPGV